MKTENSDPRKIERWIPILSLTLAIITVLSNVYLQRAAANDQAKMKRFEVTFLEKRRNYSAVMRKVSEVWNIVASRHKLGREFHVGIPPGGLGTPTPADPDPERDQFLDDFLKATNELDLICYDLRPFLSDKGRRWLLDELKQFAATWETYDQHLPPEVWSAKAIEQDRWQTQFGDHLFSLLFPEASPDQPK